jgi:hypothetical protein
MRRTLLAAAVVLGAISAGPPAFAGITTNGITTNGMYYNGALSNGTTYNGVYCNSVLANDLLRHGQSSGANLLDGSVDQVTSIVLPSGETVR